ncbi:GntR family transcriptional regulator [Mycobacterium colombiense]|uniref:GntR family transcriptional regulator n=1 Tax=Mycobacterium colombiense TaxID=339268 RepID=UPI00200A6719|nr:GntR family transcriptional regulator [Mycobacterium colombiense]MCK8647133.1 GntR family transcriptional regulator [Mycobacterium colombiense]
MAISRSQAPARSSTRLNHAVYDELKERLLEGHYAMGTRLSIEALRADFAVSKQPVMEALRRLSSDGLVEVIAQVGSRVATYTTGEIEDFFLMFAGFEGTIAGVAALRRTDEQLRELDAISGRIGRLHSLADLASRSHEYRLLNRDFHHKVHDMAHSRVMSENSRRMWDMSDFLINTGGRALPLSGALDARHADHEEILRALHAGHRVKARQSMEHHIMATIDIILDGTTGTSSTEA